MGQATSYAGGATTATLLANVSNSATSFQVSATTGWPNTAVGPFVVLVDGGTSSAEKMLVSAFDGSGNLTITTRGYDGTSAVSHNTGATIQPWWDALSAQDDNNHIYVATRNDHTQYLTTTSLASGSNYHDQTARHTFGAALGTPGTPVSAYNTSASAGSGSVPARSDHRHLGIPVPSAGGLILTSTGSSAGDVEWGSNVIATLGSTQSSFTTGAVAIATTATNVTSVSCPAGVYVIMAHAEFYNTGSAQLVDLYVGPTSNAVTSAYGAITVYVTATTGTQSGAFNAVVTLSGTTTVYLGAIAASTGMYTENVSQVSSVLGATGIVCLKIG